MHSVKVGQVWADNDKRLRGRRFLRVTSICGTRAVCESWYVETTGIIIERSVRVVDIDLARMKPNSTGYRLVKDAE